MDMSKIVYPLIIAGIIGVGWLFTSGGVDFMYNKFTSGEVGSDEEVDKTNEAGLARLGGYLMKIMRYERANDCFSAAIERYPNGENVWHNYYRKAKCLEKADDYAGSAEILQMLVSYDANKIDERVPHSDNLGLRLQKLIEVHELEGYGR